MDGGAGVERCNCHTLRYGLELSGGGGAPKAVAANVAWTTIFINASQALRQPIVYELHGALYRASLGYSVCKALCVQGTSLWLW